MNAERIGNWLPHIVVLSPLAWQREAERQRVMARLADARGEQVWGKRARALEARYARYAREAGE